MATFNIQPLSRFAGSATSIRRPREIAYFSFDDAHKLLPFSDASLSYYFPPFLDAPGDSKLRRDPIDLSIGFNSFIQRDDSAADEHLDGLLETLMEHEKRTGERTKADVVTWRGMMTKVRYN